MAYNLPLKELIHLIHSKMTVVTMIWTYQQHCSLNKNDGVTLKKLRKNVTLYYGSDSGFVYFRFVYLRRNILLLSIEINL